MKARVFPKLNIPDDIYKLEQFIGHYDTVQEQIEFLKYVKLEVELYYERKLKDERVAKNVTEYEQWTNILDKKIKFYEDILESGNKSLKKASDNSESIAGKYNKIFPPPIGLYKKIKFYGDILESGNKSFKKVTNNSVLIALKDHKILPLPIELYKKIIARCTEADAKKIMDSTVFNSRAALMNYIEFASENISVEIYKQDFMLKVNDDIKIVRIPVGFEDYWERIKEGMEKANLTFEEKIQYLENLDYSIRESRILNEVSNENMTNEQVKKINNILPKLIDNLKSYLTNKNKNIDTLTEIEKYKAIDQDTQIEKFQRECEQRKLKGGKTIPNNILYEIAKEIGMKVGKINEFKSGEKNYQIARQYASLLKYKRKKPHER